LQLLYFKLRKNYQKKVISDSTFGDTPAINTAATVSNISYIFWKKTVFVEMYRAKLKSSSRETDVVI